METKTLGDELPKEIERCTRFCSNYLDIGPAGTFGATMIKLDIKKAQNAIASGDVVQMIKSYKTLVEIKG